MKRSAAPRGEDTAAKAATPASTSTKSVGSSTAAYVTKICHLPIFRVDAAVDASSLIGCIPTTAWFVVFLSTMLLHLDVAPYSKVEESFHTQATHDLIFYGPHQVSLFDHKLFPGPVKRTFLGPLLLWLVSLPVTLPVLHLPALGLQKLILPHTKIAFQYLIRGILAAATASSLASIQSATRSVHGRIIGGWFALLSLTQFHILFWGSRTLSNVFALILFNFALASWIRSRLETEGKKELQAVTPHFKHTLFLLTFGAAIFRAELALPAGLILMCEFFDAPRYHPISIFVVGAAACFFALSISIPIDSYFWDGSFVWPEMESFMFNVIQDHSAEWGISPYHAYFTALLPRIAPLSYFLSFFAWRFATQGVHQYWRIAYPFVAIISILAHKEWRFIVYVVPLLNLITAIGIGRFYEMSQGLARPLAAIPPTAPQKSTNKPTDSAAPRIQPHTLSPKIASMLLFCIKVVSVGLIIVSFGMMHMSRYNYPGGVAFDRVHQLARERASSSHMGCSIHIDAFSAMSGVTRFGETSDPSSIYCIYSKYENHTTPADYIAAGYTYLLTNEPEFHLNSTLDGMSVWSTLESIKGFGGLKMESLPEWQEHMIAAVSQGKLFDVRPPISPILIPQVYILARNY
ncbi:hypothetical protein BASA50_002641 [Batrachochytrium salamandrivorans]|uniref:Mannosyltransferase n=1 Tax=Batrachochytrium salamandrivorans TaxID=1357716 RepID=A0ABQ8FKV7_9FUNG|nr:hypothetical protein BASA50_002641 [Batrachochytrium salamandrivorans]